MSYKYPTLTNDTILPFQAVFSQLLQYPDYLTHPDCPYSEGVVAFLRNLTPKGESSFDVDSGLFDNEHETSEVIEAQILKQINFLQQLSTNVEYSSSQKEKIDFVKVNATLLEKLISLKEKNGNYKEIDHFRSEILKIFEQIMTPDQRTAALERLEPYI